MELIQLKQWDIPNYPNDLVQRINTPRSPEQLKRWKFLSGWGLSEYQKIKRMFHFFDKAMEMETQGKFRAAEFFWESCLHICKTLKDDRRDELLKNALIKTFTGRVNGYFSTAELPDHKNRVFYFIEQIKAAIKILLTSAEVNKQYLTKIATYVIQRYDLLKENEKALLFSGELNKVYPGNIFFATRFIELCLDKGITQLQDENKNSATQNLRKLIGELEGRTFPEVVQIQCFDTLGWLYYYYGIKQAGFNNVSFALLAVRKAMTYHPDIENIQQSWNTLMDRMENQKKEIARVMQNIRRQPNTHLSSSG
ncbi:MAG: hypothetical protein ABI581_11485, partial [Sediminibacterium sp.]